MDALSKKMRLVIRKLHELKLILYAEHMIDINDQLDAFTVAKESLWEKCINVKSINGILMHTERVQYGTFRRSVLYCTCILFV